MAWNLFWNLNKPVYISNNPLGIRNKKVSTINFVPT